MFIQFDPKLHMGRQYKLYEMVSEKSNGVNATVMQPASATKAEASKAPWWYFVKRADKKETDPKKG